MSRVRSPNYPAISLPAALERARLIHKGEGRNAVAREALAKVMGYGSLNGGSATILSALGKYGLIESVGDGEARISDITMRILFPDNPEEKRQAIEEAAFKPAIFAEIREKWPERAPSDEGLRSFLTRKSFTEDAVKQVIQFYRETIDMVPAKEMPQAPSAVAQPMEPPMQEATLSQSGAASALAPNLVLNQGNATAPSTQKPFTVAFDGSLLTGSIAIRSIRDIDRLMKVLEAQKAAFQAMADDDAGDGDA